MNQLDRLEAMAQWVIEGTFQRFFRSGQPPAMPAAQPVSEAGQQTETRELRLNIVHKSAERWLLLLEGRSVALGEPVIDIGRALDNDVVLTDPSVSRYHAQLRWRDGRYCLCPPRPVEERADLGYARQTNAMSSTTPHTMVNDRPFLTDQHGLAPGDVITVGRTTLTFSLVQE